MNEEKREVSASLGTWILLLIIALAQISQCDAAEKQAKSAATQVEVQQQQAIALQMIAERLKTK